MWECWCLLFPGLLLSALYYIQRRFVPGIFHIELSLLTALDLSDHATMHHHIWQPDFALLFPARTAMRRLVFSNLLFLGGFPPRSAQSTVRNRAPVGAKNKRSHCFHRFGAPVGDLLRSRSGNSPQGRIGQEKKTKGKRKKNPDGVCMYV